MTDYNMISPLLELYLLVFTFNDLDNIGDYSIDKGIVSHKGKPVGECEIQFKPNTGGLDVLYRPYAPLEYIQVELTIHNGKVGPIAQ